MTEKIDLQVVKTTYDFLASMPVEARLVFQYEHDDKTKHSTLTSAKLIVTRTRETTDGEKWEYTFNFPLETPERYEVINIPIGFFAWFESLVNELDKK